MQHGDGMATTRYAWIAGRNTTGNDTSPSAWRDGKQNEQTHKNMSKAYKRDEEVKNCGPLVGGPDNAADGSGGGGPGAGGRNVEVTGTKSKRQYKPKLKWGMVGWLKAHYADTKNAELCKVLVVSLFTLHRYAQFYGLKKSAAFMAECARRGSELAKAKGEATGYEANRRGASRYWAYCRENGIPHCGFKKGVSARERWGEERWKQIQAKARETQRKTLARDHRRVALGLEPLTKQVKATVMTRREAWLRTYMKTRYGYIVRRGDPIIRYDDKTRRCESTEAKARSIGLAVIRVNARITNEAIREQP